ncbi:unnamed protein product [Urochloa decumbens]|uniref:Uncharacterized protein n=1 Tax=Urochloa decumbens TaxID=240449 RepID=A0ABC8VMG8_9POAL
MAIKMDKTTVILCAVVGSLGVLSAILGFSAEGTKLTPYTILVYGDDCIYPQNPALGLGICAVIFLVVAQVTISAVGGCCGCCRSRSIPSETKRIVGIVCAVFSWIAAVIAWALLIEGASWNANVVREAAPFCPYLKDGIFAGAGVLALAATALALASFIMMRAHPPAPAPEPAPSAGGGTPISKPAGGQSPSTEVVMGHPLLPVLPPESKVEHPPKPEPYVQAESNQQNQQAPPAAQDNGSQQAASQQIPPQGLPADAALAAAAACAPLPFPAPQACAETIPVVTPAAPGPSSQGNGLSTVIRNELTKATIKLAEKAVEHAVFANHAATSALSSMVTDDPTGEYVLATDNGVAVV